MNSPLSDEDNIMVVWDDDALASDLDPGEDAEAEM